MCLAVPTIVTEILDNQQIMVSKGNTRLTVSSSLLQDIKPGDYVLIHAGFAIEKINQQDAKEKLDAFAQLDELYKE